MVMGFLNFLLIIVLVIGLIITMCELYDPSFILITGLILTSSSILLLGLINNFTSNDVKLFILLVIAYVILNFIVSIFLLRKESRNRIFKKIIWGSLIISWLFGFYLIITCLGNIILAYLRSHVWEKD